METRIGRPPSCECGGCAKCKRRLYMREWYRRQSPEKRRAIIAARDPEKIRENEQERYWRHREKRLALSRQVAHRNPERAREARDRNDARNPEKVAARAAVARELRAGRMVRQPCQKCGTSRSHAHHADYSKPLEVVWLCPFHHRLRHDVAEQIRERITAQLPATSDVSDGHAQ